MGLFDLPAPLFDILDHALAVVMPSVLRLVLWGVFAGWITMVVYRQLSNQKKLGELKVLQRAQQKGIAEFDGEFSELLPLIRRTLGLGVRQLGLSLVPALLATVPVVFIVIWVAGEFGYVLPDTDSEVFLSIEPLSSDINWSPMSEVRVKEGGWVVTWPSQGQSLTLREGQQLLLVLPLERAIPVIHKKRWWNLLMANPLGYLPEDGNTDVVHIELPAAVIIGSGPVWMRAWMFSFFMSFLLSSFGFKLLLRLD